MWGASLPQYLWSLKLATSSSNTLVASKHLTLKFSCRLLCPTSASALTFLSPGRAEMPSNILTILKLAHITYAPLMQPNKKYQNREVPAMKAGQFFQFMINGIVCSVYPPRLLSVCFTAERSCRSAKVLIVMCSSDINTTSPIGSAGRSNRA